MALSASVLSWLTASILSCVSVASPTAFWSSWSWLVHRSQVASVPLPLPPVGWASIAATDVPPVITGWTGRVPCVLTMRICLVVIWVLVVWVEPAVILVAAPASAAPASATRAARAVMVMRLNIGTVLSESGWSMSRCSARTAAASVTGATEVLYRSRRRRRLWYPEPDDHAHARSNRPGGLGDRPRLHGPQPRLRHADRSRPGDRRDPLRGRPRR